MKIHIKVDDEKVLPALKTLEKMDGMQSITLFYRRKNLDKE